MCTSSCRRVCWPSPFTSDFASTSITFSSGQARATAQLGPVERESASNSPRSHPRPTSATPGQCPPATRVREPRGCTSPDSSTPPAPSLSQALLSGALLLQQERHVGARRRLEGLEQLAVGLDQAVELRLELHPLPLELVDVADQL